MVFYSIGFANVNNKDKTRKYTGGKLQAREQLFNQRTLRNAFNKILFQHTVTYSKK